MTTEAERIFARRVTAGMFKASCDLLEPAWRLGPWGTWEPNEPQCPEVRAAEEDRQFKAMSTGQILARLEAEGCSVCFGTPQAERTNP